VTTLHLVDRDAPPYSRTDLAPLDIDDRETNQRAADDEIPRYTKCGFTETGDERTHDFGDGRPFDQLE